MIILLRKLYKLKPKLSFSPAPRILTECHVEELSSVPAFKMITKFATLFFVFPASKQTHSQKLLFFCVK